MAVSFKCGELAEAIGAELLGDSDTEITSIAPIDNAVPGSITFITNPKYLDALRSSRATAVIVPSKLKGINTAVNRLVMDNPYLVMQS